MIKISISSQVTQFHDHRFVLNHFVVYWRAMHYKVLQHKYLRLLLPLPFSSFCTLWLKHFVVHCSPVYYKLVQNKVMVMKLCHLFCYADLDHVST